MTLEKMRNKIQDTLQDLYEDWLFENYPDEISCKDDFIDKIDEAWRYDEFVEIVKKELEQ